MINIVVTDILPNKIYVREHHTISTIIRNSTFCKSEKNIKLRIFLYLLKYMKNNIFVKYLELYKLR